MFCAGFGYHRVEWWWQMVRLGVFDEAAFVVMFSGYNGIEIDMLNNIADDKIESCFDPFLSSHMA